MGQVPHYLIIGRGRVARHFHYYLTCLNLKVTCWHHTASLDLLKTHLMNASHVLVLIRDDVISDWIATHLTQSPLVIVHFSGRLVCANAHGAHPLMTFGPVLHTLAEYQQIPFVIDADAPPFTELLPGLPNQHVRLAKKDKAKYHALCVLGGNFSCLLWQKLFSQFAELGLPEKIAFPYLLTLSQNLVTNAKQALTGPLARADMVTIQHNIDALANDPFQAVYQAFVTAYFEETEVFN